MSRSPESSSPTLRGDLVLYGRIGRPFGVHGEVLLQPFFRKSEIPPLLTSIHIAPSEDETPTSVTLGGVRKTAAAWALTLPGVRDADAARALTHHAVWVDRSVFQRAREMAPDAGDELYSFEVEGFDAVGPDGQRVGRVMGFENFGGGDLLVIKYRGDSFYLPFAEPHVGEFDFVQRSVPVAIDDFLPPRNSDKAPRKSAAAPRGGDDGDA